MCDQNYRNVQLEFLSNHRINSLTLYKSKSSKNRQFEIGINLCAVNNWIISPHTEPVVVGQRGSLLEAVKEDDENYDSQTNGLEVLFVQLQLHLQ